MDGIVGCWFVALAGADIRTRRLPNNLVLPAVSGALAGVAMYPHAAAGMVVAGGIYLVAYCLGGCGGGDVKLAVVVGALAGSMGTAVLLVLCAQVVTLAQVLIGRGVVPARRETPHGPSLCASAALCCGLW